MHQYQWSRIKYTLKDLIAQRKDKLPAIINVAEGYSGADGGDAHDVAAGSVFFVYAIEVQSRIVAQTEDEMYLSMSRTCPVNFQVILNDRSLSEPCLLNDIVLRESDNLGDLRIRMAAPDAGGLGPMDAGSSDIQGTLRVLDLYDERYLLCHAPVEEGGSFCVTNVISVPSYLPLTVLLATGIKHGSRTDFKDLLNRVNSSATKFQQKYAKQPKNAEEIVVFSDPPNGDYEYIEATSHVSRIPSVKIVGRTGSPGPPEVATQSTTASPTETAVRPHGEFLTVPRLPPRNLPRTSLPNKRPQLEEMALETRVAWIASSRRPLPLVPDKTGRGSLAGEPEEAPGSVESRPEAVKKKKTILPLPKKESRFQKANHSSKSPWHSPKFPLKFGNNRSPPEEAMSEPETQERWPSTGDLSRPTSIPKSELRKTSLPVTLSPWYFTSLKRHGGKSTPTSQKPRPPVPKKPSVYPTVPKKPELTSRNATGALTELDESPLDVSGNSVQRPGTLTLDSSGYEDDYESYYDEIKSPTMRDRRSRSYRSSGADEEDSAPQEDYESRFIPSSDTLSLRSTDTGRRSDGRPEDSNNEELDSSYEEISLPPSRKSSATDSGFSSAATNVSTPNLHSGVHNFINVRPDSQSSQKNTVPNTAWPDLRETPTSVSAPETLHSAKRSWRSLDEVPLDTVSLSVSQVSECLAVLNLGQYVRTFRKQQIDGALLSCLDRDVLVSDFGFRKFDAIKLAKFAREGWRPKIDEEDTLC